MDSFPIAMLPERLPLFKGNKMAAKRRNPVTQCYMAHADLPAGTPVWIHCGKFKQGSVRRSDRLVLAMALAPLKGWKHVVGIVGIATGYVQEVDVGVVEVMTQGIFPCAVPEKWVHESAWVNERGEIGIWDSMEPGWVKMLGAFTPAGLDIDCFPYAVRKASKARRARRLRLWERK